MAASRIVIRRVSVGKKKLHKSNAGEAWKEEFEIYFRPQLTHRQFIEVAIHESLHCMLPDLKESEITDMAGYIGDVIWHNRFKKLFARKRKK